MEEVYLGDGLYASFDGFQIMLRAPRESGDHWVGLEPAVMAKLIQFVADLRSVFPGNAIPVWEALAAAVAKNAGPT